MAQTLSAMGTKIVANAAAVQAAMTGTTTAEATALGNYLINLGKFPSEALATAMRTNDTNIQLG